MEWRMVLAINIFPDYSLISVVVVFLILFAALNRVLFQPLFRIMEERVKRTTGVIEDSTKILERYTELLGQYEQSIRAARTEGYKIQEQIRGEAMKQATDQHHQARHQAEGLIQEAKQELHAQREQAKTALAGDATSVASLIA